MIDPLESRLLLADMTITGTESNDNIILLQPSGTSSIEVSNKGLATITVKVGTASSTIAKGSKKSFGGIGKITLVDLGKGDDKFTATPDDFTGTVGVPMTVTGGDGKDSIIGGDGPDVLAGDKATGTGFNDTIRGGFNNDTIYGYAGNDFLYGDASNDSIRGGMGNDFIDGGSSSDKVFGEAGNDSFKTLDYDVDTVDGGSGTDSAPAPGADKDVISNTETQAVAQGEDGAQGDAVFIIYGTDKADTINASVDSKGTLTFTINGVKHIFTAAQRTANTTNVEIGLEINGLGGDDKITVTKGITGVYGGVGNDSITAGDVETLLVGDGRFRYVTDEETGFRNREYEPDPAGNDTIIGSQFADRILGGGGADLIRPNSAKVASEFSRYRKEEIFLDSGDTKRDTIDFSNRTVGVDVKFAANGKTITVTSKNGNSTISNGSSTPPAIIGGPGADTISGSDLADSFSGGLGNDLITGNGGNDTLLGNDGNDTLNGSAGNDLLRAGKGDDRLKGDIGNDAAFGEDGNDTIDLDAGNDYAEGGAGNDLIFNADGAKDTIKGGSGTDTASKAAADLDLISEVEVLT